MNPYTPIPYVQYVSYPVQTVQYFDPITPLIIYPLLVMSLLPHGFYGYPHHGFGPFFGGPGFFRPYS